MMFANTGFGIVPTWQLSSDPTVNPKLNPFVTFPDGVTQSTVQPLGPSLGATRVRAVKLFGASGFAGFGSITDTVSSLGSVAILVLAGFGAWGFYKKIRGRR